jgi:ABC-type multidrug transport system fused ATPase/permease subunit
MKEFFRVLSYAGEKKSMMTKAAVLLTLSVLFSVAPFFLVGASLNAFWDGGSPSIWFLLSICAAILICQALKNYLNGAGLDASHKLAYYTLAGMRRRTADKMLKMSMGDVEDFGAGPAKKHFDETIEEAAQCHEFILETENGYDTVVGASGNKLSGGQKQRICIARAMLKDAPIVILDEATSFADPENEDKIQEALSKLIAGKTVVIVAHRLPRHS